MLADALALERQALDLHLKVVDLALEMLLQAQLDCRHEAHDAGIIILAKKRCENTQRLRMILAIERNGERRTDRRFRLSALVLGSQKRLAGLYMLDPRRHRTPFRHGLVALTADAETKPGQRFPIHDGGILALTRRRPESEIHLPEDEMRHVLKGKWRPLALATEANDAPGQRILLKELPALITRGIAIIRRIVVQRILVRPHRHELPDR